MPECRLFKIQGIVQGVFYRANTEEVATALDLTGWVRNTDDGGVECMACGDSDKLDALEKWLWKGPMAATVNKVDSKQVDFETFNDFSIRR